VDSVTHVSKLFRPFQEPPFSALPLFVRSRWIEKPVQLRGSQAESLRSGFLGSRLGWLLYCERLLEEAANCFRTGQPSILASHPSIQPSATLREYLGAHRRESIETARKLIELIPPAVLKAVLGYLVLHYWAHRSGWPDLLVYRPHQWFLAEIKSWRDKLNENQKRWIEDNHRYLHLPFKLVQVHRLECNVSSV
jgi:hypothetical protein